MPVEIEGGSGPVPQQLCLGHLAPTGITYGGTARV